MSQQSVDPPLQIPHPQGATHAWMRRDEIRRQVSEHGFVTVEELARTLGVSQMTIHRDLADLEARGYLRKVRGGATSQATSNFHGDMQHRLDAQKLAKQALSQAALKEIETGQIVFIDDSTTCLHLAMLLPEVAPLTVVTNFLPVIQAIGNHPAIDMVGLGGSYAGAHQAFLGPATAAAVEKLRGDVLFMSTTAVTDGKCFHQSPDTVMVKQALMEVVSRRILVVDHTKFARRGMHHLADLSDFDIILVDDGIPAETLDRLAATRANIRVVPVG
ncbi:MAG TPA: DeoR/GlpR family DNA-binding transcription regulator [Rugosimonospora sp.]